MGQEQSRLEQLVGEQFAGEMALNKEFGLYGPEHPGAEDVAPPADVDAATRLLITKLTTRQVAEILARAQQPQLQLEPIAHFKRYVRAIDNHPKMPGQNNTYVDKTRRAVWARQDAAAVGSGNRIVGWNLGITDVSPELEFDRSLRGSLGEKREKASKVLSSEGLRLLAPRRYALAAMRALKKGKPLDAVNWSVLDDDTGDDSVVPGGDWSGNQVSFFEDDPEYVSDVARFRPEVVARAA